MLPARNRQSALPLDSPSSWQEKFSVSLEFSSRIPRSRVHMEQNSLAVSHGRDTEHTHAHAHMPMHACTHTRKTSSLHRPTCCLLLPTGFGLCSWRKVHADWGGGRRQSEGAEWLSTGTGVGQGLMRLCRAGADLRNAAGGAAGAVAGPAWAGSSARAQPVPTRAGAQSCSHPFPWAVVHSFRNSHDSQQPKWPSPSA